MIDVLPFVNAALNSVSALLLITGFRQIRRNNIAAHRACMIAAFAVSVLFLISYLTYHAHVGVIHFQGQGWIRSVYFIILITHTILAAVIVPFVATALILALLGKYERHKRVARWAFPMWLYVCLSGIAVYALLYHLPV